MDLRCRVTNLRDRLFPTGFMKEFKVLMRIASPMLLTQLSLYTVGPISLMFCGRLGKTELAAAALAISVINVTVSTFGSGLGTSCDTIFSQIYGSNNKKKLGVELQKYIIYMALASCPSYAIVLNAENALLGLGQDPEVARIASAYLLRFSPAIVVYFIYTALSKYMLCQSRIIPCVCIGFAGNIVNAICHYVLLYVYDYGLEGSAWCQVLTYAIFLTLSIIYILATKMYTDTWEGWSKECFTEWGDMVRMSVAGLCMLVGSWASFEVSIFFAGYLGTTVLGAQSVIFQIEAFVYMIPLSSGISAGIVVGQYLGAANALGAYTVCNVALLVTFACSVVVSIIEATCNHYLPLIFTNVQDAVDVAAQILPVMALYSFAEALSGVCTGVFRGSGRHHIGTCTSSLYIVGLAISAPLMLKTSLGIFGFWYVLVGTTYVSCICGIAIICRTNWDKQVEKASVLVGNPRAHLASMSMEVSNRFNQSLPLPRSMSQVDTEEKTPILRGSTPKTLELVTAPSQRRLKTRELVKTVLVIVCLLSFLVVGVVCRVIVPQPGSGSVLPPANVTDILDGLQWATTDVYS